MRRINANPFLKWAGGKGQLLPQFEKLYPNKLNENKINKYIEAFVGSGAVFFELIKKYNFNTIILNDLNEDLILTYNVIKYDVKELIHILKNLEDNYLKLNPELRQETYYEIRKNYNEEMKTINYNEYNETWILHAAHFIFLNRTCFNGLYRLNKKGEFNVPIGRYINPTICNENNLLDVSQALENVILICNDFEQLTSYVDNNTFVYMDPPYRPLNSTSNFTSYSKMDFNDDDQIRLAHWFEKLSNNNAFLMLSNSNPKNTDSDDDFFENLYEGFNIQQVFASRQINSKASNRGKISELVIRNYSK